MNCTQCGGSGELCCCQDVDSCSGDLKICAEGGVCIQGVCQDGAPPPPPWTDWLRSRYWPYVAAALAAVLLLLAFVAG